MNAIVDINRVDWKAGRVVHCRLPAWEAGTHESVSTPSSIGLSFTTQLGSTVEIDGKTFEKDVTENQLVLIGRAPVSWLRVPECSELIEITGSRELRLAVASELGVVQHADLAEVDLRADPVAWTIAATFRGAMRGGRPVADLERDALIRRLYASVFERVFGGASRARGDGALDQRRLKRATEYVEANLGAELSLDQIADVVALSPFHFSRAFRATTGVPPHRYATMRRMERSKQRLLAGEEVSQVAGKAGYTSRSWFARAFRQHFGFGPHNVPIPRARGWSGW